MKFAILILIFVSVTAAAERNTAEQEIAYLLEQLASSNCEFFRNGRWYDSDRAVSHLNRKYSWLEKRDLVPSTKAFIERAASESSRSGEAYRVRCAGEEALDSAEWLEQQLAQYRGERSHRKGQEPNHE